MYDDFNQKLKCKSKSAHDILTDETLSKELAIPMEELIDSSGTSNIEDSEEREARMERIREKLKKRKRKAVDNDQNDEEEDFDEMIKQEMNDRQKQELEKITAEVKLVQKDLKAMLKPKQKKEEIEEEKLLTEATKKHLEMKQKFRENAKTMSMLEKILAEHEGMKSVIPVKARQEEEKKEEPEVSVGKLNYDSEVDLDTAEILVHKFVAPEEDSKVSKAKDANLREESEDWYDITDPRNKINQRRRGVLNEID
ncbi:unnamed protein product [Brugia pahangi]|uniref:MFAP1 domain-containing protein n=1 Tax=Brugia pahangi TaxID=6280 RepID=A0A0N4T7H8_BRUPA|nr:unnamed protein product [Brugia pahangi]